MTKPRLLVFAGPNGSGKSTLYRKLAASGNIPDAYINADDIAREELGNIPDYLQRNIEAARLAEQRRKDALANGRSFVFETVMSTPGKLAILQDAKARGFVVELVFVTTQDAAINIARVKNRAALGGHDVEPTAICKRFARTMDLLPSAISLSDAIHVFDNSGAQMIRVATKRGTKITLEHMDKSPGWIFEKILAPSLARQSASAEISQACQKHAGKSPCIFYPADIRHGASSQGKVVAFNEFYAAQHLGKNRYLIHDMALCPPMRFRLGKNAVISYCYEKGGKHKEQE